MTGLTPADLHDLLDPGATSLAVASRRATTSSVARSATATTLSIMGNNNQGTGNNIHVRARATSVTTCTSSETTPTSPGTTSSPGIGSFGNNMSIIGDNSSRSGNNTNLGAFGFANNIGLIGSAATGSGNNTNMSPFVRVRAELRGGRRRCGWSRGTTPTPSCSVGSPRTSLSSAAVLTVPATTRNGIVQLRAGRIRSRTTPATTMAAGSTSRSSRDDGAELLRAGLLQLLRCAVRELARLYR